MFDSGPCDWLGLPLLLPSPTTQFSLDHKRRSRKRNRKKWKRSDSSDSDSVELMYDSAYDSDIRFSVGRKLSYESDCDSDSVASENQPLVSFMLGFKMPCLVEKGLIKFERYIYIVV